MDKNKLKIRMICLNLKLQITLLKEAHEQLSSPKSSRLL